MVQTGNKTIVVDHFLFFLVSLLEQLLKFQRFEANLHEIWGDDIGIFLSHHYKMDMMSICNLLQPHVPNFCSVLQMPEN